MSTGTTADMMMDRIVDLYTDYGCTANDAYAYGWHHKAEAAESAIRNLDLDDEGYINTCLAWVRSRMMEMHADMLLIKGGRA